MIHLALWVASVLFLLWVVWGIISAVGAVRRVWRNYKAVMQMLRGTPPPRVPLLRRIVAGLKYELDLLRHYKYARHQTSRRIF